MPATPAIVRTPDDWSPPRPAAAISVLNTVRNSAMSFALDIAGTNMLAHVAAMENTSQITVALNRTTTIVKQSLSFDPRL